MKNFLLLILLIPLNLFSQITISGTIKNAKTNEPVEYATVYINGTTKGTITDKNGMFKIPKVKADGLLVVSHINFKNEEYKFESSVNKVFNVVFQPNTIKIEEISVTDKNLREKNLKYFHEKFFGAGKWGDYSFLMNDSVLNFNVKNYEENNDIGKNPNFPDFFEATANAPLHVKLPLLGYDLYINLKQFVVRYNPEIKCNATSISANTFYKLVPEKSKFKEKRIKKNRLKVYYNSHQHFFRSLYNHVLKENGYEVLEYIKDSDQILGNHVVFNLDRCIQITHNKKEVVGLKDKLLYLIYYPDGKIPLDISELVFGLHYYKRGILSKLYIRSDRFEVQATGKTNDINVVFGPHIGNKLFGAWLPYDYDPDTNK